MRNATGRTYRLATAGVRALASEKSVPAWYRNILGLIRGEEAAASVIRESMNTEPTKQVFAWIDELEFMGFIVADPAASPIEPPDAKPEQQAA